MGAVQCSGNDITAARGYLVTDHVIWNHGQVTWSTPKLVSPSPNYHTSGRTFRLSTDLTCHRVRRRNVNLDYEARGDPIDDPSLKYKTEFYFFTLHKTINALESRFDLVSTHSHYRQLLYNICDLKYTHQNDELKYCNDLETVLTDGNSPDINALYLADEIVVVLALLNKKESPIKISKFRSNLDFAPNLGIVLKILLTLPISVASGERSYSKLKLIKKFLRSTSTEDRLNGLTTIAIEHELAEEINVGFKVLGIINIFSNQ
ncbi:uncharacterized protein TNCV_4051071 [Trichonephila clavipes]|nr:uncharacterized protein TNCV_4051071 [Trichonephila clavipes]